MQAKKLLIIFFMSNTLACQEKPFYNPESLKNLALARATKHLLTLQQSSTLNPKTQRLLSLAYAEEDVLKLKNILVQHSIVHRASPRYNGRMYLSPDHSKMLVVKFPHVLWVIDPYTGKKCLKLPKARFQWIENAGWSPCGNYIWAHATDISSISAHPVRSHLIRWWDINKPEDPQTIPGANSIHFSPCKKIITAGRNKLTLYDLQEKKSSLCKEFSPYAQGVWPRKKEFSQMGYEYALEKMWRLEGHETPEEITLGPVEKDHDLLIVYGKAQNYLCKLSSLYAQEDAWICIPRGKALFYIQNGETKIILEDINEISLYDIDKKTTTHMIKLELNNPDHDIDKLHGLPPRFYMEKINRANNRLCLYVPGIFAGSRAILDLNAQEVLHQKNNLDFDCKWSYTPDLSSLIELRPDGTASCVIIKTLENKIIAKWDLPYQFTQFRQSPRGNYILLMDYHQMALAGILNCDSGEFIGMPHVYQYNEAEFLTDNLLITYDQKQGQTHFWHLPAKQFSSHVPLEKLTLRQMAAWHVIMNNKIRKQKICPHAQQALKECSNEILQALLTSATKN